MKKIVDQPGPDRGAVWSPDGKWIAFSSAMGNPKFFHANARIGVVGADGGPVRSISDAFDEQPSIVDWKADGLYFAGLIKNADTSDARRAGDRAIDVDFDGSGGFRFHVDEGREDGGLNHRDG